jgi:hypothetical protein
MPTEKEVMDYMGIDYADDMVKANINRAISTADAYLKGAIGKDYPKDDPRAKELSLIFIADLYDNRGVIEKVSGNVRRLVDDMILQLKLELMRSAEEV